MFNTLDIAVLCDKVWTDADGNRRTADRSRHGIHPVLGDGTTPGTFPTFDALNGRFTFDGGDYMQLRNTDDVASVLASMASAQVESYIFYFKNLVLTAATDQVFFYKENDDGDFIRLRYNAADQFQLTVDTGPGNEELTATAAITAEYTNKHLLLTFVRAAGIQEIWAFDRLIAADTDATRDASGDHNAFIGCTEAIAQLIRNDSGIAFFGYGRFRALQTWLGQLSRSLRGVL